MTENRDGGSYSPNPWPDVPVTRWDGGVLPSRAARRAAAAGSVDGSLDVLVAADGLEAFGAVEPDLRDAISTAPVPVAPEPVMPVAVGFTPSSGSSGYAPFTSESAPTMTAPAPRRVSINSAAATVGTGAAYPSVDNTSATIEPTPVPMWHPTTALPAQAAPMAFQPVASPQQIAPSNYPPAFQQIGVPVPDQYAQYAQYGHYGQYPDQEPEPKKRKVWIPVLVTLALFAGLGAFAFHTFGGVREWFENYTAASSGPADYPAGQEGGPIMVTIPSGASGARMGELLAEAGVVASQQAFVEAFRNNPRATSIAPGTYELQTHMTAADAVNAMLTGGVVQTRLVIPEGFTKEQVFSRMESTLGFTREDIDAALADPESINLPEVAEGNPEGWLFPATYNIQPNETAADVLRTMINRTRQELVTQGADPAQWEVILNKAALIEREVRDPADLPKVARAIQNRIDRGINLQIDAAVAYGLGISGTLLTRAHLADPSNPFNTYQHPGLPPTPIANPGAAAINAALNPAEGDWIFWVTINLASGETIFTNTYAEHQRYVAQLRQWQRDNPGFGQPGFVPGENLTD